MRGYFLQHVRGLGIYMISCFRLPNVAKVHLFRFRSRNGIALLSCLACRASPCGFQRPRAAQSGGRSVHRPSWCFLSFLPGLRQTRENAPVARPKGWGGILAAPPPERATGASTRGFCACPGLRFTPRALTRKSSRARRARVESSGSRACPSRSAPRPEARPARF